MISHREREALAALSSMCNLVFTMIAIGIFFALAQNLDERDQKAAEQHAARQAAARAQAEHWVPKAQPGEFVLYDENDN